MDFNQLCGESSPLVVAQLIAPVNSLDALAACVEWLPSAIDCATTNVGDNRYSFVKLHTCKVVSEKIHQPDSLPLNKGDREKKMNRIDRLTAIILLLQGGKRTASEIGHGGRIVCAQSSRSEKHRHDGQHRRPSSDGLALRTQRATVPDPAEHEFHSNTVRHAGAVAPDSIWGLISAAGSRRDICH